MAGVQSYFRNVIVVTGLRLTKNGALRHSSRGNHILAFQKSAIKNTQYITKFKLLKSSRLYPVHRSISTNVADEAVETVLEPTNINVAGVNTVDASASTNASSQVETPVNLSNVIDEASLPPIPSLPKIEDVSDVSAVVDYIAQGLKEPTFKSLGLGSWWPPGILQQVYEYLHINLDLPWWGAILAVTTVIRLCLLPIVIKAQKNNVVLHNNLPQLSALQLKMTQARKEGNYYDTARYAQEIQIFMKEKGIASFSTLVPPLVQAPIFISMFLSLRGMTSAPVESLKTGGLFWFQDLTVPDPYYILPISTAATLLIVLELGAEGSGSASQSPLFRYGLRALPLIMLPFTLSFPGAILFYWSISNAISLFVVSTFKIPFIRKIVGLPPKVQHKPESLPPQKGAIEGFKDAMANIKITKELEERERLNTVTFDKAGRGPVPRTFKKNPTQVAAKSVSK